MPGIIGLFLIAGAAFAQGQQQMQQQVTAADTVTDAEMEEFVKIVKELQEIRQNIEAEVQSMVEDEGLEFKRFQMIVMSKRDPKMAQQVEVTDEEEQLLEKLMPKLQTLQRETQQEQLAVIEEGALSGQRFDQIAKAVQTDPDIRKQFEEESSDSTSGSE